MTWKPTKSLKLTDLVRSANVCDLLAEEDIASIASRCMEGYRSDKVSRADWERRQANANKLALQVSDPARTASFTQSWGANVKFPLITVAVLQFQARAYLNLISGTDVAKFRVIGQDPDGSKTDRAQRIGAHMSWQCLEEDPAWEEDTDKLLIVLPLAGMAFRKTAFEPGPARLVSQLVLPQNLVTNYYTRDLEDAQRYTHTFYFNANNIRQREIDKRYRELPEAQEHNARGTGDSTTSQSPITEATDKRQGVQSGATDEVTPFFMGEQYCWLDLDGDGYEEPYIVTLDLETGYVRRVVARFLPSDVKFSDSTKLSEYDDKVPGDKTVYKITPVKVFTRYRFIPSPDGGYYDLGLGSLLGPINATVNTALNQMLDAGTMATLGGGFLGNAFKGAGGPITFQPRQWHHVPSSGDDIRKSVFPLPIPEPSDVLFRLMGLLIQYAERIISASDIQMGDNPGQNTPAQTTQTLNENGRRVYAATYKRIWRCLRDELRVRYEINQVYLTEEASYEDLTSEKGGLIRPDDYEAPSLFVRPSADPYVLSEQQLTQQGMMLVQLSDTHPGFNRRKSMLRFLNANHIPNIEEIYPVPMQPDPQNPQKMVPAQDVPPLPNAKMLEVQVKGMLAQMKEKEVQLKQMDLKAKYMIQAQESTARIDEMRANTAKLLAEAKSEGTDRVISLLTAAIESEEKHRDRALKMSDQLTDMIGDIYGGAGSGAGGGNTGQPGMGGMAGSSANAALPAAPKGNGAGAPGPVA